MNNHSSRSKQLRLSLSAVFILWLTSMTAFAADFRKASWGMSLQEVLTLHEGEIPSDRRIGYVAYEAKLASLDVYIFYRFDEEVYQSLKEQKFVLDL